MTDDEFLPRWRESVPSEAFERREQTTTAAYYAAVVKELCRLVGVKYASLENPTFEGLEEVYPELPARFFARRLANVHLQGVLDFFNAPHRTVMVRAWMELATEFGDDSPVAMVFPWTGLRRGGRFMVIHNVRRWQSAESVTKGTQQARIVLTLPSTDTDSQELTIERLADFVGGLVDDSSDLSN